jgi:uncharacterized coiled-coil DUF342 family protein
MEHAQAVRQLQQENASIRSDIDRMTLESDRFRKETGKLRAERGDLRLAIVTRENKLSNLQTEFEDVTYQLEDLRRKLGKDTAHSTVSQVRDCVCPTVIYVTSTYASVTASR